MNNSTGFIITGIIVGVALAIGGGIYMSNSSSTQISNPLPAIIPSKEEQGYFYSGGKRHRSRRNKHYKRYKTSKNKK
jgi:hypothetical protein